MSQSQSIAVILVAAGRGSRAGEGLPKQYRDIGGRPLLAHTLDSFLAVPEVDAILTVIHPDDASLFEMARQRAAPAAACRILPPTPGANSRQTSTLAGLRALAARPGPAPDFVLIHDAARPFASPQLIARAIASARQHGATVPVLALTDTIKQVSADGAVLTTVDRTSLRAAQTPQAFAFGLILAAHEAAAARGQSGLTDDAAIAEAAGHRVTIFAGEPGNIKITTPSDFAKAEAALAIARPLTDIRTGQGFDVHAFAPGDHVWLGGLRLAHSQSLAGHSDADVALHALTDAILGALADGDIGAHFPPSDPQWRGARSEIFLQDAAARVARRGGRIAHLDLTLICEAPKIEPHREAMRASVAAIAGVSVERVAVKATTSEGLGFTGRREGIAAMALATLLLPEPAS